MAANAAIDRRLRDIHHHHLESPAAALTWAMPLPIVPAPITPIVDICMSLLRIDCRYMLRR